jgi:site-specific recombinase XerD
MSSVLISPTLSDISSTLNSSCYPHENIGFRITDNRNQSGATNDYEAIQLWIERQTSERTKEAYAREVFRLIQWAIEFAGKPICALTLADFQNYKNFLRNPPKHWIGPRRVKQGEKRKLLVGRLSEKSIEYAITCIASLLAFWTQSGYIQASPLASMKRRKETKPAPRQSLSAFDLGYISKAIDAMPQESKQEIFTKARFRWAYILFIRLGLRIDEIVTHHMSSFLQVTVGNEHQWQFLVWGKGINKDIDSADILPVTSDLLAALYEFRKLMGWIPNYPVDQKLESSRPLIPRDSGPYIADAHAHVPNLTAQHLRLLMNDLFHRAADMLENNEPDNPGITRLRNATPHILRHTAITLFGNACNDVRIQQKFARHKDLNTTMIYHHVELDQIRDVMIRLRLVG